MVVGKLRPRGWIRPGIRFDPAQITAEKFLIFPDVGQRKIFAHVQKYLLTIPVYGQICGKTTEIAGETVEIAVERLKSRENGRNRGETEEFVGITVEIA